MLNTLQISDFEMHSRNQDLNLKSLRDDLTENDRLENPLIKMGDNIRMDLKKHPLLKMETSIRLKMSRLLFLKNQLVSIHSKPP